MSCRQCNLVKAQMREQIIKLHLNKGITLKELSESFNCHRNTLSNWKLNYLENGFEGLIDKSRKPHSHPNTFDDKIVDLITKIRINKNNRRILGPLAIQDRLKREYGIEISRSGIAKVLERKNLVSLKRSKRNKKKNRIKKWKIKDPGELLQMDVKYAFRGYSGYWYYQYSGIDYLTGLAYADIYEIQSNLESILFTKSLVKKYPFNILGVQTDNHSVFTNRYTGYLKSKSSLPKPHPLDLLCDELNIEHYLIDKGKPAQNGKVERFHRTCEEEFYQREIFKDLNSARRKLRDFLYHYNHERSHQGLDNLTPVEKLKTFPKYEKIDKIF